MSDRRLQITFAPISLKDLDRLSVEALVLAPFVEDLPLRSAAGFCDWRLNGRISQQLQSGWFSSQQQEVLWMNSHGRIAAPWVLIMGQGSRQEMDLGLFSTFLQQTMAVLAKAKIRNFAIELPGVDPGPLEAPQALTLFYQTALSVLGNSELTVLCPYPHFAEVAREVAGDVDQVTIC